MRALVFTAVIFTFLTSFSQNALNFDGSDDGVDCGNASTLNIGGTAFSVEAWVYADVWKTNAFQGTIILKENNANNGGFMFRAGDGGKVNLGIGAGTNGAWTELTTGAILNTNTWYHLAGTYDGAHLRIYVNGILEDSLATTVSSGGAGSTNLTLGYHPTYTGRNWDGKMDEVRVWDTTLSETQINANMNSEFCTANVSHLVGYYKLDEGNPQNSNTGLTTTIDYSGNNNDGSLVNFTLSGTSSNWDYGKTLTQDTVTNSDSSSHCGQFFDAQIGQLITQSDSFFTHYVSHTGCDSLHKRYIEIIQNSRDTIIATVCDSFISPKGRIFRKTGTYYDVIANNAGCDSIIQMHITVPRDTNFITTSACNSYESSWGMQVTQSGTYYHTFNNSSGCDSIEKLDLIVFNESFDSLSLWTCDSVQNLSMTKWLKPGDSNIDTISNSSGCDSIITIRVESLISNAEIEAVECEQYTSPSGIQFIQSGTYSDTIQNNAQCDSIITIQLTIHNPTSETIELVGCDELQLPNSGNIINSSGMYYDTIVNHNGCDSFLTMDVTINTVNTHVTVNQYSLISSSANSAYQWLDCDKNLIAISGQTDAKLEIDSTGNYAVEVTDQGCKDTSECHNVIGLGINKPNPFQLKIVPNPSNGQFTIYSLSNPFNGPVIIYNATGQIIFEDNIQNKTVLSINQVMAPGVYYLRIGTNEAVYSGRVVIISE